MIEENLYGEFWISDGILFFVYRPHTHIDLKAAKAIVKDRIRLQNEKSYPILCDMRQLKNSEKPGRDYLAHQGSYLTKAVAILIERPYSKAMMDFYLKTCKPTVPTMVFTSRVEALDFLEPYK